MQSSNLHRTSVLDLEKNLIVTTHFKEDLLVGKIVVEDYHQCNVR
jgi:hypothetical protein